MKNIEVMQGTNFNMGTETQIVATDVNENEYSVLDFVSENVDSSYEIEEQEDGSVIVTNPLNEDDIATYFFAD